MLGLDRTGPDPFCVTSIRPEQAILRRVTGRLSRRITVVVIGKVLAARLFDLKEKSQPGGGAQMPVPVRRFLFAAIILCAGLPARGADISDYGTKNFSPGVDTPSYFTSESNTVLGSAENEGTEDGGNAAMRSVQITSESRHVERAALHRYRKFAAVTYLHSRGRRRAIQLASSRTFRAKPMRSERTVQMRQAAGFARYRSLKSTKPPMRHASANF
jgi:hypothetical protein